MKALIAMLKTRLTDLICKNAKKDHVKVNAFEMKTQEVSKRLASDSNCSLYFNVNYELYRLSKLSQRLVNMRLLNCEDSILGMSRQCRIMQERLIVLSLLLDFDLLTGDGDGEALPEKDTEQ